MKDIIEEYILDNYTEIYKLLDCEKIVKDINFEELFDNNNDLFDNSYFSSYCYNLNNHNFSEAKEKAQEFFKEYISDILNKNNFNLINKIHKYIIDIKNIEDIYDVLLFEEFTDIIYEYIKNIYNFDDRNIENFYYSLNIKKIINYIDYINIIKLYFKEINNLNNKNKEENNMTCIFKQKFYKSNKIKKYIDNQYKIYLNDKNNNFNKK